MVILLVRPPNAARVQQRGGSKNGPKRLEDLRPNVITFDTDAPPVLYKQQLLPKPKKSSKKNKMSTTPTSSISKCFPFAINCKLVKMVFRLPQKCSYCQKLIFLSGFSCQFCRYRCHKRCAEHQGRDQQNCSRPKLCSLSRLPSDDKVLEQVLRENEINANDMDAWLEEYCDVFTSTPRPVKSPRNSCEQPRSHKSSVTHEEPSSSSLESEVSPLQQSLDSSAASTTAAHDASMLDRFCRLFPWSHQTIRDDIELDGDQLDRARSPGRYCVNPDGLTLKLADLSSSSGIASPVRTPIDEYNEYFIKELFHNRHASGNGTSQPTIDEINGSFGSKDPLRKRLNWVKFIAGDRGAYSQDRVVDHSKVDSVDLDAKAKAPRDQICATWPLSGLHMNYDNLQEDNVRPERFRTEDTLDSDRELWKDRDSGALDLGEWHIPFDDLQFLECISEQKNMSTHKGLWHGDVMIHTYETSDNADQFGKFMDEVRILMKIRHENIVLFMGASVELPKLAVVTTVRKGESLYDTIHFGKTKIKQDNKVHIAKQIAQGMGYLHAKGIVLKTLCSKNVHLETKVKISMINYASPRLSHTNDKSGAVARGHLAYWAPEMMSSLKVAPPHLIPTAPMNKETDIYSYGTVLYEMFAGDFPFATHHPETVVWLIGSGRREDLEPLNCSVAVKSLLEDCWSDDPSYRPQFTEILNELNRTASLHKKHSSSVPDNLHKSRNGLKYIV